MRARNLTGAILCALALAVCASGRQGGAQATDDVLRINAELVQTGVTVLDARGRFVDGLRREDFELRVDGRAVPVAFFENVLAGSARDQLVRAARGAGGRGGESAPSQRRRTVVFFLDDRHLSLDSLGRARAMLLDFIDNGMGEHDLAAVASSSGRVGFLQQFTGDKEVLRAAVARLGHVPYVVSDYGRNPGGAMTEFAALTVERRDDPNVFEFYVQDCLKWAPRGVSRQDRMSARRHCEGEVQNRARQILLQSGAVTSGTYYSLETLLRYAERMPGSKLAFFVSDGFLSDTGPRGPVSADRLARIADRARRAGVVFYTIDARGLTSGGSDATGGTPFDADGRLEGMRMRETAASQAALDALAADTGGRALRDQNEFGQFVRQALSETSRYYLIAWRPEADGGRGEKLRKIEVGVRGRPELTVRSARGFVSGATAAAPPAEGGEEKGPEAELRNALTEFYPRHALPLQLSLVYLDTPASGTVLNSSVQAPAEALSYGEEGTEPAQLTLAGVVLDEQGKPAASFGTRLKVAPPSSGAGGASTVIYNHPAPLKPGIYQVRAAARDERSRLVGSAAQWIVIPDLSTRALALSSLIVGLEEVGGGGQARWSVDRRFARGARLRFMTFVYNAARTPGAPADLAARVEVYGDGRALISTPFKKVSAGPQDDQARLPFTAEIELGALRPGSYTLRVTVEDRAAGTAASRQTDVHVR